MPQVAKKTNVAGTTEDTKIKKQPWKAVWPAPESAPAGATQMAKGGSGELNGSHGYNDKGEGIAPKKAV